MSSLSLAVRDSNTMLRRNLLLAAGRDIQAQAGSRRRYPGEGVHRDRRTGHQRAWRARASAASPSHLRRFADPVRHVLLAALLFQRQ